jgi:hypothetical protein
MLDLLQLVLHLHGVDGHPDPQSLFLIPTCFYFFFLYDLFLLYIRFDGLFSTNAGLYTFDCDLYIPHRYRCIGEKVSETVFC